MTPLEELAQLVLQSQKENQEMIKENQEMIKRIERENEEIKKRSLEIEEQMKKETEQMKKDTQDMKKTLKALGINVDGINKTTGLDTEEFFYSSIQKDLKLNGVKFDSSSSNLLSKKDGKTQEIDIFLENGNSVGIIEVKTKVKEDTIEQLDNIIENFYYFHPSFKGYKIIGAIAGKVFPQHLQEKALKKGYTVITQKGDHIEYSSKL